MLIITILVLIYNIKTSIDSIKNQYIPDHPLTVQIKDTIIEYDKSLIEITDTLELKLYYPRYSRIDLVCGNMPAKNDSSIIFMASAAYTLKCLNKFEHSNIIGNHVSGGKLYHGSPSNTYRGAFIFYNDSARFIYNDWVEEMRIAAENGGCGFAQDMMIHADTIVNHWRSTSDRNAYRALCKINGKVAIADSKKVIKFGDFIDNLIKAGASEAIYLDMGGWNYSWYRDNDGKVTEIHTKPNKYATNWITFYR